MSVSIKPLEDRIVVRPLEAEQVTASGLVIPDTAKEKPQEAEVVAVGPGRFSDEGDRIPVDLKFTHSNYKTDMPCTVISCHSLPASGLGNLRACCLP